MEAAKSIQNQLKCTYNWGSVGSNPTPKAVAINEKKIMNLYIMFWEK